MVRQGEVYDHAIADRRYRILVVSADAHNDVRTPWVAPIRHGAIDAPPYLVSLLDADPFGGVVDIDRLARITPQGESLGILTGATMQRVRESIYTLFAG